MQSFTKVDSLLRNLDYSRYHKENIYKPEVKSTLNAYYKYLFNFFVALNFAMFCCWKKNWVVQVSFRLPRKKKPGYLNFDLIFLSPVVRKK